jgi:transcriptional regulator with XRE-family HTH domain
MGPATEIQDFAQKIGVLLDRLNWSRAALAQRVGVDKSVAQRWVAGKIQPGASSLVALTAAIAEVIPGFTRADWRLPVAVFTARYARATEAPAAPPRSLLPGFAAAEAGASATARYGGLWLLLHASVLTPERPSLVGYLASVGQREGGLRMAAQGGLHGTWRAEGPLIPLHHLLYLALEEEAHGDSLAFGVLNGVITGQAMVIDGIGSSAASSLRGPVAATRLMGLRLDDEPEPAWKGEAMRRLAWENGRGLGDILPASLVGRFLLGPTSPERAMVLTVGAGNSLACDAEAIARGLAPEAAAALAAVRGLLVPSDTDGPGPAA